MRNDSSGHIDTINCTLPWEPLSSSHPERSPMLEYFRLHHYMGVGGLGAVIS